MAEQQQQPELTTKQKVLKELREWVVSLLMALIVFFIVRTFLFTVISVDGSSMETTLHDRERLIVSIIDQKIAGPQRGDPVICHYPDREEYFVKRLIALPGDHIAMRDGITYVNDEPVDETEYIADPDTRPYGPWTLGSDEYFVMGDNRNHSNDSRFVGPIHRDMILGKVQLVMWPFNSIRMIK